MMNGIKERYKDKFHEKCDNKFFDAFLAITEMGAGPKTLEDETSWKSGR